MTLPAKLAQRLTLPLIAAPMLRVSGPDIVSAACRAGVIGSFPTINARNVEELDAWMTRLGRELAEAPGPVAPVCPNIIMRRDPKQLAEDLECLIRHKVEIVLASVGSPAAVVKPLHDAGCLVLADVATIRHAEKALEAGADGLMLLAAGAGGQTGWANALSFVRAVRSMFDGPLVLSGGISDGAALWAARVLGADLGCMGTKFIATDESMGKPAYKMMLVDSELDDIVLTKAFTGLQTNMLRPSVIAAGMDPAVLDEAVSPERAREIFSDHNKNPDGAKRWTDIWSAGHSVSGVHSVQPVASLVAEIAAEYLAAQKDTAKMLALAGVSANS